MGVRRIVGVCATVAIVLSGCGTSADQGPSEATSPDPVELIGAWQVHEAPGEPEGSILQFDGNGYRLWRSCGYLMGGWAADRYGAFVSIGSGGSGACRDEGTVSWLAAAASFQIDGSRRWLLDQHEEPVALLIPGGRPAADPHAAESLTESPVVTDQVREGLSGEPDLPTDVVPAKPNELLGRWYPSQEAAASSTDSSFFEFHGDQVWEESNACGHIIGGRWNSSSDGSLVSVGGPVPLVVCLSEKPGISITSPTRAGFSGNTLILMDRFGETVRISRG